MKTDKIKIAVIGAGNVGASTVHYIAKKISSKRLNAEIVLLDVVPKLAEQKALDFNCAKTCFDYNVQFTGSTQFNKLKDADVIVHTAGIARKPGMDRMDLLKTNVSITKSISKNIVTYAPKAILIVVANPLDVIATVCYRETKFPAHRIIGMAGVLDSARYNCFISEKINVIARQIQTMVLGGHGDTMVPITQYSAVAGIDLTDLIARKDISAIENRTKTGGGEIVKYLKTGSAYYAPAASAADMVGAIISGERRIMPASVYLQGEYGVKNLFLGVPTILGPKGLEKIIEVKLTYTQKKELAYSVKMVTEGINLIKNL